jgi:type II secretory pathway pseudopilin PulG
MLIAIGVILILAAMLLPVAAKARQRSRTTSCSAHLQQIGQSFVVYASENKRMLPQIDGALSAGNAPWAGRECDQTDTGYSTTHYGSLLPYLTGWEGGTRAPKIYRCPGKTIAPRGQEGSNGVMDYSAVAAFSGARLSSLPLESNAGGDSVQPPMIMDENGESNCNTTSADSGWYSNDKFGTHHNANSIGVYVAIDGSVDQLIRPLSPTDWTARGPSTGNTVNLQATTPGGWKIR